jgi:hypothetical protein
MSFIYPPPLRHPQIVRFICLITETTLSFGHDPNLQKDTSYKFDYCCADLLVSARSILKRCCWNKSQSEYTVVSSTSRFLFCVESVPSGHLPMSVCSMEKEVDVGYLKHRGSRTATNIQYLILAVCIAFHHTSVKFRSGTSGNVKSSMCFN